MTEFAIIKAGAANTPSSRLATYLLDLRNNPGADYPGGHTMVSDVLEVLTELAGLRQAAVSASDVGLDLAALRQVAIDASKLLPGAWKVDQDDDNAGAVSYQEGDRWISFAHCSGGCLEWIAASAHIATFDPPTVLALIQAAGR